MFWVYKYIYICVYIQSRTAGHLLDAAAGSCILQCCLKCQTHQIIWRLLVYHAPSAGKPRPTLQSKQQTRTTHIIHYHHPCTISLLESMANVLNGDMALRICEWNCTYLMGVLLSPIRVYLPPFFDWVFFKDDDDEGVDINLTTEPSFVSDPSFFFFTGVMRSLSICIFMVTSLSPVLAIAD